MTKKQANILFIPTSIWGCDAESQNALSYREHYWELVLSWSARSIQTLEGCQLLGRRLIATARNAWAIKHLNAVEQASELMLGLPIADQLESIARYYQALCTWRRGDINTGRKSLEHVVEKASPQYRARALQAIGLTYHTCGEVSGALPFYLAAGKSAPENDVPLAIESQRVTAVVRSIHGDHERALADLEKLFPAVRAVGKHFPVLYYEFLNSLAVELAALGRLIEAEAALSIALASPFAPAYPEWAETRLELEAKRTSTTPSVVAFSRAPEREQSVQLEAQRKPEPPSRLAFGWPPHDRDSFQISVLPFPATASTDLIAISILNRVLICAGPRAPPVLS